MVQFLSWLAVPSGTDPGSQEQHAKFMNQFRRDNHRLNVEWDEKSQEWILELDSDGEKPVRKSIVQLVAEYLAWILKVAEDYTGNKASAVCLAVNQKLLGSSVARERLLKACKLAKVPLINILPSSMSMLYAHEGVENKGALFGDQNPVADKNVAVVDMGASGVHVSLLGMRSGVPVLLKELSLDRLSGRGLDTLLLDFFAQEFQRKHRMDLRESKRSVQKLLVACESVKRSLSRAQNAFINVESLHEGIDFNSSIHRIRWEVLIGDLINETVQEVAVFLKDDQVDSVVLGGGVSAVPLVQTAFAAKFDNLNKSNYVDPVEACAIGATYEALLAKQLFKGSPQSLWNTASKTSYLENGIGILVNRNGALSSADGDNSDDLSVYPLFRAKHPLPAENSLELQLDADQEKAIVTLVEFTEDTSSPLNWSVLVAAELDFTTVPNDEDASLELTVALKADGDIHATIKQMKSRKIMNETILCSGMTK